MRMERKQEHIENYLKSTYRATNLLEDIYIEHMALPDLDFDEIDTEVEFLGKKISFPLVINAITGGGEISSDINESLARLAKEFHLPMAVGSQKIALEEQEAIESFELVRSILPKDGIVIGNLSATESLHSVKSACQMIDADAMQLHLNVAQELIMEEGERKFKGVLENIEYIRQHFEKPIIVKEVGFGLGKEAVEKLYRAGIRIVDVAGHGGTNFAEIEDSRRFDSDFSEFYTWGIPTAKCLLDIKDTYDDLFVIAGGGIRRGTDIIKAMILGADMVSVSGELLSYLMHGEYDGAKEYLRGLILKTKMMMLMLGAKNCEELKQVPFHIEGRLKDLME